ncbi:methyltransferase domain-containing protein [Candidatus Gracilibacteria bacterium]|nr:methyltransferase domain-containing protein [Candidatus Gracilibacteria bacterium]MCF7898387.1 methyltransferase domain-containing protein [Candidatus Paceibacterota bacterium]
MSFLTPEHLVRELYLKPGDRVADIGCGTGVYTIALAQEVGEMGQVYAVDVHREALHTLAGTLEKRSIQNVEMLWADVEQHIPIDGYSLDAVVISNVLFQLGNINQVLLHVSKILKPDGQLLIVEWSDSHGGVGPHKDHVITEEYAEDVAVKNNFRILKRLPAGSYHYAFIAIS